MSTRIRTFKADGTTPLFSPLTNIPVYDFSRLNESRKRIRLYTVTEFNELVWTEP